jgi:uncharacterized RDD family membrane protein YckC
LVIDLAIVLAVLVAVVILGDLVRDVPGSGRVLWLILFADILLYEPIMIWRYGATIGHRVTNLRVVDDATGGNPGFVQAFARFVIKSVLGVVSFVTMALTRRYQAVHDRLTHTTVQIRDLSLAQQDDYHVERVAEATPGMPSRLRRGIVMLAYMAAVWIAIGIVVSLLVSVPCIRRNECTAEDQLIYQVLALFLFGGMAVVVVAGWRGHLLGCRIRSIPGPLAPEDAEGEVGGHAPVGLVDDL